MTWWILLIFAAASAAAIRVFVILRRMRAQRLPGWDEKQVRRLREQGLDPFAEHELDFFFSMPDAAAAHALAQTLEGEGFATDTHAMAEDERGMSLHARKSFHLSVDELTALSKRFTALASAHGGRYDSWMAAHVPRGARPAIRPRRPAR